MFLIYVGKLVNVLRVKWIQIIRLNYNSCNKRHTRKHNIYSVENKINKSELEIKYNIGKNLIKERILFGKSLWVS